MQPRDSHACPSSWDAKSTGTRRVPLVRPMLSEGGGPRVNNHLKSTFLPPPLETHMPVLVPPAPNLRPSQKTYVDGYNSIMSRVRRRGGAGSGGVVVFVSVDVVSVQLCGHTQRETLDIVADSELRMDSSLHASLQLCSSRTTSHTASCPLGDTRSSRRGEMRLSLQRRWVDERIGRAAQQNCSWGLESLSGGVLDAQFEAGPCAAMLDSDVAS